MKALILTLLISCPAWGKICSPRHPIYCQIIKNKPIIDKRHAMKISNIIHKYSRYYQVPAKIYTAILMQESGYNLKAKNCTTGLDDAYKPATVCFDFGMSQINFHTAKYNKFDIPRLTKDLTYSIKSGIIVLKHFKSRYGTKEKKWWSRYNTGTPSLRRVYERKVGRWL